jgi:hypothetical protein
MPADASVFAVKKVEELQHVKPDLKAGNIPEDEGVPSPSNDNFFWFNFKGRDSEPLSPSGGSAPGVFDTAEAPPKVKAAPTEGWQGYFGWLEGLKAGPAGARWMGGSAPGVVDTAASEDKKEPEPSAEAPPKVKAAPTEGWQGYFGWQEGLKAGPAGARWM